jgi:hypothetical protein
MPMSSVIARTIVTELIPLFPNEPAPQQPVNLQPSTTFAAGTVLGISGVAANAVQTLTTTGTPTGGSQTVTFTDPLSGAVSTFVVPFDSSSATAQTAARAAIGNSDVAVTGGAQPGTALVFTFTGRYASQPVHAMTTDASGLTGGTTPAATFAQTTVGRSVNTYGKYVGAGATDPAKCLLRHACVTDAAGWISYGSSAYLGEGMYVPSTPAYFGGVFLVADLTGLDDGAVVDLGGKLSSGTIAARGILRF